MAAAPKRFVLWHWVESNGDGSVSVRNTVTKEAAEEKDGSQPERWGEPSVGSSTLEFEDGKLYLVGTRWDSKLKQHVEFRHELEREVR